jgi:hypothetical protein
LPEPLGPTRNIDAPDDVRRRKRKYVEMAMMRRETRRLAANTVLSML